MFVTLEMAGAYQTGLSLVPFSLHLLKDGFSIASFQLDGQSKGDAIGWLDEQQETAGLNPSAHIRVPYKMDPEVMAVDGFGAAQTDALAHLAGWFALAQVTPSQFADENAAHSPGPSPGPVTQTFLRMAVRRSQGRHCA